MTIEERVLGYLHPTEGTEVFNLPCTRRQAGAALQRLKRKGLAEAALCPDGAWVWFAIEEQDGQDTSFAYYWALQGVHVHVHVFAGPDEQHRAHAGNLTFREREFQDWRDRVEGPGHTFYREDS